MTRRRAGSLAVALCLAGGEARAGEAIELAWDGPASCGPEGFERALAGYLGDRTDPAGRLKVRVRVAEEGGVWSLELAISEALPRRLTAESCAVAADAGAFIVAQAIDERAAAAAPIEVAPAPAVAPVPESAPAPVVAPVVAPEVAPVPRPAPRLRAGLRVSGGVGGGALPGLGGVFGLAVGVLGRGWRVELGAGGRTPTRAWSGPAPTVGASLAQWAVGPRGCGVPRRGRLEVPLCLGVELGQVIARSVGLAETGRSGSLWAAATISPGVHWALRPWLALTLQVELAVPLVRRDFAVRGLPVLHRLGPVEGRGLVGVEFRPAGRKT